MGTARALRVALIQSGRIVEDRTFTGRSKITVGTDAKSTFLVPMSDLPMSTPVFEVTKHGTALLFDAQTEGRVSVSGADAPLHQYVAKSQTRGSRLAFTLPDDAKGRVSIGEVSLLFQFVDAPKKQVPAELPKGARGLVAQLDRSFIAILVLSLGAHFAGAGYLKNQPVPEERDLTMEEMVIDRWAKASVPPPKVKQAVVATAETPKTKAPEAAQKPQTVAARPSAQAIKDRIQKMGIIGAIGVNGTGFGDILQNTGMKDIAEAMKDAKNGLGVASVDDATASQRKGNAVGVVSEIDPIGTEGVKDVGLVEKGVASVTGRVTTEKIQVDTRDIDELKLSHWLQGRKSAIQSCYERELKRTPTLQGRLVIRFAIDNRGHIGGVGFDDDTLRNSQVQLCISALMRAWVLPFNPQDDVPVSLPFIFSAGH